MADGVLGLGSGQASALNSDLIEKLKTAERKSTVEPIETKITNITGEKETFATINSKVKELLASIKPFDLFVSSGVNAFEQKSATTSGDSVTFDAVDLQALKKGFTSVSVSQLAQKDAYQSNITSDIVTPLSGLGELKIGDETFLTEGKTYKQLADEITAKSGMNASVEQVGTNSYRLVIKSEESGIDNALSITGAASQALGYTTDGTAINTSNHILEAKNMLAKVDGVDYNVSSNNITVDGLKITANKVDSSGSNSTINIIEDNTQVETLMNNFITKYNELVALVDTEVLNADSKLADKSSIRDILSQVKNKLFGSYGDAKDKSIFNYGIELDKFGGLTLDSTKFNKAVQEDMTGLKDLFLGKAENKGLGTQLKELFDDMTITGGMLDTYDKGISTRETNLNAEKEKAEKALNAKYEQLSLQFASYGAIINQMESSFSGLKLMIQQSTAS
jgi:flagellar hook-associated protein 2